MFSQSILRAKADQDTKSRKRATIQNLPKGANHNMAWTRLVIPNFIHLLLAGEQPWIIGDDVIILELQKVWNHVYGRKIPFTIKKGTVPFELVSHPSFLIILLIFFVGNSKTLWLSQQAGIQGCLCCFHIPLWTLRAWQGWRSKIFWYGWSHKGTSWGSLSIYFQRNGRQPSKSWIDWFNIVLILLYSQLKRGPFDTHLFWKHWLPISPHLHKVSRSKEWK